MQYICHIDKYRILKKNVSTEVTFFMMSIFSRYVTICLHKILKCSYFLPKLIRMSNVNFESVSIAAVNNTKKPTWNC